MHLLPPIALSIAGNEYLLPYFERQFPQPKLKDGEKAPEPACAVKIIVGDTNEDDEFDRYCEEHGLPVVVIECPAVVCTGMQGLPRRIAAGIYKGTYFHIRDNGARISVVHATDVTRAAALAAGTQGCYVLTDGCDPTVLDLAQALSFRLGDKRVFQMVPWLAKIWYGKTYYGELTSDHTMPDTFAQSFPGFKPVPVVEYLRTHDYGDDSL